MWPRGITASLPPYFACTSFQVPSSSGVGFVSVFIKTLAAEHSDKKVPTEARNSKPVIIVRFMGTPYGQELRQPSEMARNGDANRCRYHHDMGKDRRLQMLNPPTLARVQQSLLRSTVCQAIWSP